MRRGTQPIRLSERSSWRSRASATDRAGAFEGVGVARGVATGVAAAPVDGFAVAVGAGLAGLLEAGEGETVAAGESGSAVAPAVATGPAEIDGAGEPAEAHPMSRHDTTSSETTTVNATSTSPLRSPGGPAHSAGVRRRESTNLGDAGHHDRHRNREKEEPQHSADGQPGVEVATPVWGVPRRVLSGPATT